MNYDDGIWPNQRFRNYHQNTKLFIPSNEHHYMEITEADTPQSQVVYKIERKRDDEIPNLGSTAPAQNSKWVFRLLLTPMPIETFDMRRVPFSCETVEYLDKHWHIPTRLLSFYWEKIVRATSYCPNPQAQDWKGLWLPSTYIRGILSISHNPGSRTTNVVYFGLDNIQCKAILDRLVVARNLAWQPFLAPFLKMQIDLWALLEYWNKLESQKTAVMKKLGIQTDLVWPANQTKEKEPDLTEMPTKITSIACASTFIGYWVSTMENSMICSEGVFPLPGDQSLDKHGDISTLRMHLHETQAGISRLRGRNDELKEATQALVQLVYALLAQKDNQLNHQYGADMRIIAAVTLIFLPGTFMATLFSASFWNFQPTNTGPIVSKWVWLYWVMTVILTATVMGAWRGFPVIRALWSRREQFLTRDEEKKEA